MVKIIVGDINSGKTSRLLKIYETMDKADGFIAVKTMMDHKVLGYDMLKLSTKEKRSFIVKDTMLPEGFKTLCKMGPYCFSKDTLEWVEKSLREMVAHGINSIFLDEIGPLELEGQCFDGILEELMDLGCQLYITVRSKALDGVIDRYNIREYECLEE